MIAPLVFPIESQINGLLSQCREPGTREALRQIGSNAASTSIIARQLLASTGCHPIRCESVQLNELIDHQIAFFSHVVDQRIQLQTNLWENLPVINADPGLVELMLRNLVLNGAEAMPKGGTITFSTAVVCLGEEDVRRHGHARPGTYVCLSVADAGSGISAAAQTHLFEPFFTTKQGHGLGLGLATVQGIIQQHSGWVEVSSHANSGSRFALFFPVVNADN